MKKNRIMLLMLLIIMVVVASLYTTFALIDNGNNDNQADYNFILDSTKSQEIKISSKETKTIDINVNNPYEKPLNYAIAYSTEAELNIGISDTSQNKAEDTIEGKTNKIVSIIINNDTDNTVTVNLSVITGYINGGDLIIPKGKKIITQTLNIKNIANTNLDTSGANVPKLLSTMIPIYFDENDNYWHKADKTNTNDNYEWYNYENKKWANVALVTKDSLEKNQQLENGDIVNSEDITAYLVWIPRFKYQVWDINQTNDENNYSYNAIENGINIVFEKGTQSTGTIVCTDQKCDGKNNDYYTHPSFKLGDKELTGFWIGKFETTGVTDNPTILPNFSALTYITPQIAYDTSKIFESTANTQDEKTDSHPIKMSEWSAVAYLTNSTYGICNGAKNGCRKVYANNSTYYNTGSSMGHTDKILDYGEYSYIGQKLDENGLPTDEFDRTIVGSTTGNIYGVYDMAGGAQELIMLTNKNNISFLDKIDSKYYDVFNSTNQLGWIQYQEEITDITTEQLWITAGATNTEKDANIFKTSYYDGNSQTDTTFRIVLS